MGDQSSTFSYLCIFIDLLVNLHYRVFYATISNAMKVIALVSGGKDSCYNMMECVRHGHEIVAIANLAPPDFDTRM
jgi:hypothetical protein